MNLKQLKYFEAVCSYGTVSEAAERLHIAQPSLSNAIKELEDEFGVDLFRRKHKGMELTDEGATLRGLAKGVLHSAEELEVAMKELGDRQKLLRLGVPPMIGAVILSDFYADFVLQNGDVLVKIVEGGKSELCRMLADEKIDMAFLPHERDALDSELSAVLLGEFEMACVSGEKIGAEPITPERLDGVNVVLFEDEFFQTEEIKKWFFEKNVKPSILLQTGQLSTMMSIVSGGGAVGFAFRELAENSPRLNSAVLDPPIRVAVSLAWRKKRRVSEPVRRLADFVRASRLIGR